MCFHGLCLLLCASALASSARAGASAAVPTFESIGLYWSPAGGAPDQTATLRYRPVGDATWIDGHPLWFDARTAPAPPFDPAGQYRGSIVHLDPGTTYEIELSIAGGEQANLMATTWSETFPIGTTVELPLLSTETLVIDQSGTPAGYVLYTPVAGQTATIDVAGAQDQNILVQASYVIIRGLTLVAAEHNGIEVAETGVYTDIVIEDNDISGWGEVDQTGFGVGFDAAVRAKNPQAERIIIQRNVLHHPRGDTNSWCERRDGTLDPACSTKPEGPHGIRLLDTAGNHVIRYNTIETDSGYYFSDCIGGGSFSYLGFPVRDSDIYGNDIERCRDDGIESEGGNPNVRIWGNLLDRVYTQFGITPVTVGPIYFWRNVTDRSRKGAPEVIPNLDDDPRGRFVKAGGSGPWYGGRVYLYHNTTLQRPAPEGGDPLGVRRGISTSASEGEAYAIVSRNNILQVTTAADLSIKDDSCGVGTHSSDFDHDLYNGMVESPLAQETNGIFGTPIYDAANGSHEYFLDAVSPGYEQGMVLPNFSDGFSGAAPELGAFETGLPPLEYGVNAYGGGSPLAAPPGQGLAGFPVDWIGDRPSPAGAIPSAVGMEEPFDNDGDGFHECQGDCDDADPDTYEDAPEVHDLRDNQCLGDFGYGVVDETSADSGFMTPGDRNLYSWTPQAGATLYQVVRSTLPDFTASCSIVTTSDPFWTDPQEPDAGGCFHYLNRAVAPYVGSWGQDSQGDERVGICTAGLTAGAAATVTPLVLDRGAGTITLSWGASCSLDDDTYGIYEGALGDFTAHIPVLCSSGGTMETLEPAAGDRYYLVVPRNGTVEGSYGTDGSGSPRPPSASACVVQSAAPCR